MKKLFRIAILLGLMVTALTVCAFATSSVTETSATNGAQRDWKYTATLDGTDTSTKATITADQMYVLIVVKNGEDGFPAELTADKILYIDQKTATATDETNNTIVFSDWGPKSYVGGTAYISGGSLANPVKIGVLPSHGIKGDVDSDNEVTLVDARLILQELSGSVTFDATQLDLADTDGDDEITLVDARLILQMLAGIVDSNYQPIK